MNENEYPESVSAEDRRAILRAYAELYKEEADNSAWFDTVKVLSEKFGFASDMKAYKADPSAFKGSITDVSTVLRVAVTGRSNSPDLYSICTLLGEDRVKQRLLSQCD